MNLYLTKDGVYAGTQKDAGRGHMAVDVPTDKAGLIAYLNGVMGGLPAALAAEAPVRPVQSVEDDQAPFTHSGHQVRPALILNPGPPFSESRGALKLRQGDEASSISDWVLEHAPSFGVSTILSACLERIDRMVRQSAPV